MRENRVNEKSDTNKLLDAEHEENKLIISIRSC